MDVAIYELPHDCMEQLSSFIQKSPLKVISLYSLTCTTEKCEGHLLDLGMQQNIQKLDIICKNVIISDIKTQNLKYLRVNPHSILHFRNLSNAGCLTELQLVNDLDKRFLFTEDINYVLHTLHQLETFTLFFVDIASRSLTVDSNMTNLKEICFYGITMDMETAQMFVDSLFELPNIVNVFNIGLDIDAYLNVVKRTQSLEVTRISSEDDDLQICKFNTVK
jgi:hypothetical protein